MSNSHQGQSTKHLAGHNVPRIVRYRARIFSWEVLGRVGVLGFGRVQVPTQPIPRLDLGKEAKGGGTVSATATRSGADEVLKMEVSFMVLSECIESGVWKRKRKVTRPSTNAAGQVTAINLSERSCL